MELFRIQGLSSEDLLRPGKNNAKAFLGTMFKMGEPAPAPPSEDDGDDFPDEPPPGAVGSGQTAADGDARHTEQSLAGLSKDALIKLAGSLGVADISGTKQKLIESILGVQ